MSNWQTVYLVCKDCPGGGLSQIEKPNEHIDAGLVDIDGPIPEETCGICGKPMSQLEPERASEIQEAAVERNLARMREWGIR